MPSVIKTIVAIFSSLIAVNSTKCIDLSFCQNEGGGWCYKHNQSDNICPMHEKPTKYRYSKEKLTWQAAHRQCVLWGGALASIHSQGENTEILANTSRNTGWWIGLNNLENENNWVWNDKSPTDFVAWFIQDGNRGEDCAFIYHDGKWHDAPCSQKNNYVCKIKDSQGSNVYLAILIPIVLTILIVAAICICCNFKNKSGKINNETEFDMTKQAYESELSILQRNAAIDKRVEEKMQKFEDDADVEQRVQEKMQKFEDDARNQAYYTPQQPNTELLVAPPILPPGNPQGQYNSKSNNNQNAGDGKVELDQQTFDCSICMQIANHDGGCPKSCSSCGAIYCSTCFKDPTVNQACAICRKDGKKIVDSFAIKKMCEGIKNIPKVL